MSQYNPKKLKNSAGAVALIFVIMVTTLTIVAGLVVSLINISDLMAGYHLSEAEVTSVNLDACIDDALARLASSTDASGTYYLSELGTYCYYQIDSAIDGGLKIVTTTASTTSDVGSWSDTVIVTVNVSTTPVSIYSYRSSQISYSSFTYCGDGTCNGTEDASSCGVDCQVCGNGEIEGTEVCDDGNLITEACGDGTTDSGSDYCNSDCTATYAGGETCDDGDTYTERCGDGVQDIGTFCNADCSSELVLNEVCDYTFSADCETPYGTYNTQDYVSSDRDCSAGIACSNDCTACASSCL